MGVKPRRGRHAYPGEEPRGYQPRYASTGETEVVVKEVLAQIGLQEVQKWKRVEGTLAWVLVALLAGVLAGVILRGTVVPDRVTVLGESMEPTYHSGQRVLVYPHKGAYSVGDVVVVQEDDKKVIKRVIATSGDVVSNEGSLLKVNGKVVAKMAEGNPSVGFLQEGVSLRVGPGTYFILGDNTNNSKDSRTVGTVGESRILGVVK